jgi:hypothetical protein
VVDARIVENPNCLNSGGSRRGGQPLFFIFAVQSREKKSELASASFKMNPTSNLHVPLALPLGATLL